MNEQGPHTAGSALRGVRSPPALQTGAAVGVLFGSVPLSVSGSSAAREGSRAGAGSEQELLLAQPRDGVGEGGSETAGAGGGFGVTGRMLTRSSAEADDGQAGATSLWPSRFGSPLFEVNHLDGRASYLEAFEEGASLPVAPSAANKETRPHRSPPVGGSDNTPKGAKPYRTALRRPVDAPLYTASNAL